MFSFPITYLNSNDGSGILAFGGDDFLEVDAENNSQNALLKLEDFIQNHKENYLFGFLSYDLKNEIENLKSSNKDGVSFPSLFFWNPKYVVELKNEKISFLQGEKCDESFDFISYFLEEETDQNFHPYHFNFKPRIDKSEYLNKIKELKKHIQLGNIYEVNFCQEFYDDHVDMDFPLDLYFKLNQLTQAPFSSFCSFGNYSIYSGSPERFLKKTGSKISSEPIKGTARRGNTLAEDEKLIETLKNDPKERSENIMIVDLVRNDLSKIALKNSVTVEELCGIYSFETVHQMISTISCEVPNDIQFTDIIKATFPMGSMTGAPKRRAMELIESHESFKRGLYSGSIGYIKPNGDFDFNVVIRTLLYNKSKKYLSCSVGSAITILSDPEKEFEECEIKIKRILDGLND
ncbi:MAG: anthranilate synthase component I family protein [Flavobacteriia bacterium]|nr:anthranilate synthase component I family protein [Flavobacteriia bacterium]